jgi:YD repeat-containing protein
MKSETEKHEARSKSRGPDIRIDKELASLIPPLTQDEYDQLEASLLKDNCRDPLIVWKKKNILLDGHNRLKICHEHNLPYHIVEVEIEDKDAAKAFILRNQLSRRNLSPEATSYLRGKRYLEMRHQGVKTEMAAGQKDPKRLSEQLAAEYKVGEKTIRRDARFAEAIDVIAENCGEDIYYSTLFGYDNMGRQDETISPTGTINRTVYDGLGRVVSTWVGTNDTPASGEWSPTNNTGTGNMVEDSAYVYDNGGVGDSNLTQETDYPGGGAAPRVTRYFYDWRDRQIASKSGVQAAEDDTTHRPITFTTYDNLNEDILDQQYDGDGVTVSTVNGEPQAPSGSLLVAQTAYSYDDQGRLYQQQIFDVNPSTGAVSPNTLTTNYYFDLRGYQIAESDAGGLWTKDVYDGAGRLVTEYTTDGGSGTNWVGASTVASDIVLEQTETIYDADSNTIETIDRQRFDDATGTGALGDATTGVHARVYYTGNYYDSADRLVASVDVGTNGGTPWVRPTSVPDRSDTMLVTSYSYNPAGWVQDTVDPAGIDTRTLYDTLGRITESIVAYTDGVPTNETNQTTAYTYDGDGNTLTVTVVEPSGTPSQTTQYLYGVTTAGGSAINSNDLLAATLYPDPTTGQPSSSPSEEETYTYNALGQVTSITDRNGNTHSYSYDVLGRQISDTVTTLGAGVDGSIRRIDTAYDAQGNAYLFTSYADTAGTSIVNQVLRQFNGLGQLTAEYQSVSGPVNLTTTPAVRYAYTEMAGGVNNSRLVSITYPSGYVLDYNYGTPGSLNDRISRLYSLSDTTGTLEAYKYLGLSTVVERDHPQSGLDLTYISQDGSTGDAGDKYTGLDRFGRIVELAWIDTLTSQTIEDLTYSYDRDNNVTAKNNLLNTAVSEQYTYNLLNELTSFTVSFRHGCKT